MNKKRKPEPKEKVCDQCSARSEAPLHNAFNQNCIKCGAAGIKNLQRMRLEPSIKRERLQSWLTGYMADGHDETELRRLAKT